jgi:trehalose 6-phosphate phosphatase
LSPLCQWRAGGKVRAPRLGIGCPGVYNPDHEMQSNPPALDSRCALFLDFDGTLVDIAPTPDAVVVPPSLTDVLGRLAQWLDGAVALVSGRPLSQLDRWLAPLALPAAGVHGAERRRADGVVERRALAELDSVADVAYALAMVHPGLLVERKTCAVALHYRGAPQCEALCRAAMHEAVGRQPALHLMNGKMVIEALPRGVSKGHAVEEFMGEPPFKGRHPVFVGDDVTDEAGFEAVQRIGGTAVRVGRGPSVAAHGMASPREVLRWLSVPLGIAPEPTT